MKYFINCDLKIFNFLKFIINVIPILYETIKIIITYTFVVSYKKREMVKNMYMYHALNFYDRCLSLEYIVFFKKTFQKISSPGKLIPN